MEMKILSTTLLLLFNLIISTGLSAQNVTGRLFDQQGQPLAYANIVLLSLPDSAFIAGVVSKEDGTFDLNTTTIGQLIRISSIGYVTKYLPMNVPDLGTIQLTLDIQQLNEIVIKSNLPTIRIKNDAMVTNIENSVLSKEGSASDVLEKMPGIVKRQDSFEVFGKGTPLIYIDGRKLRDITELEQLSSSEIKNIEIVRNPGSRYDATIKAVVRIQTIKHKGEGFSFNLRSSYHQSKNTDWIEQINLNYRTNNLDIFSSLSLSHIKRWQKSTTWQQMKGTKLWEHNEENTNNRISQKLDGDIGFNYQVNENHSFGIKYRIGKNIKLKIDGITKKNILVDNTPYDILNTFSKSNNDYDLGHQLNAYYRRKIGKNDLEFNVDYYQDGNNKQSFTQEISVNAEDRDVNTINSLKNRLAASKLTTSFPFGSGTFTVGTEATYTHRKYDYVNLENFIPTSHSKIDEINTTGFAEYNHSFPWGNWIVGLRYEHVKFDYYENNKHSNDQSREFNNLFPNISFSTSINSIQAQLSYTAKTERPSYSQLSNNIVYADRYTQQTGDPTLKPSTIHDVTLVGVWRFLQLSMSYTQTKNWILYWGDLIKEDGSLMMLHHRNWNKSIPAFSAFLSASPTIGCWSPILGVGVLKQWLTIESNKIQHKMDMPLYLASFNNIWKLPNDYMISLDMRIQSKGVYQNIYMKQAIGSVDISLRKSFLKDALNIELKGSDLFNTDRQYNYLRSGDYTIYQKSLWDHREFSLIIRYKFNSVKSKYKGTGAGLNQRKRM